MDFKRLSEWNNTISSVIRKTDLDMIYMNRPDHSFVEERSIGTSERRSGRPDVFLHVNKEVGSAKEELEQALHTSNQSLKEEISELTKKLVFLEQRTLELETVHRDTEKSVSNLHERSAYDYRRIEEKFKQVPSHKDLTDLKMLMETNSDLKVSQIELKFNDLEQISRNFKEEASKYTQNSFSNTLAKFVKLDQFQSENSKIQNSINSLVKSFEKIETDKQLKHIVKDLENNIRKIKEDTQKEVQNMKNLIAGANKSVSEAVGPLQVQAFQHKSYIDDIKTKIAQLDKSINGLRQKSPIDQRTNDQEKRLESLENTLKKIDEKSIEKIASIEEVVKGNSTKFDKIMTRFNQQDSVIKSVVDKIGEIEIRINQIDESQELKLEDSSPSIDNKIIEFEKNTPTEYGKKLPDEYEKKSSVGYGKKNEDEYEKKPSVGYGKKNEDEYGKKASVGYGKKPSGELEKKSTVEYGKKSPVEFEKKAPVESDKILANEHLKKSSLESRNKPLTGFEKKTPIELDKKTPMDLDKKPPTKHGKRTPVESVINQVISEFVQREIQEGIDIVNHSVNDFNLYQISSEEYSEEENDLYERLFKNKR